MGSKRKAGNPLGIAGGLVGILGSDMGYSCKGIVAVVEFGRKKFVPQGCFGHGLTC